MSKLLWHILLTQDEIAGLLLSLPRDDQNNVPYSHLVGAMAGLLNRPGFSRERFVAHCFADELVQTARSGDFLAVLMSRAATG